MKLTKHCIRFLAEITDGGFFKTNTPIAEPQWLYTCYNVCGIT